MIDKMTFSPLHDFVFNGVPIALFLRKITFSQGKLIDGSVVAIKQLSETSHQGKKEFIAEIETISRVQHRNLMKLFGFCLEGNKPLLVYEYMENGSLDKALFGINHFIQFIQQ